MENTSDILQRFLFENAPIRGELVHLNDTWRTILGRHDYPPALRDLLGELAAAAVLLAATLKLQGALILQIQGNGPLKLLVVECSGDLQVRATAKWTDELEQGDLSQLVGDGRFAITLDPRNGKQSYQGIVALEGGSVAEILQNYMTRSEQLETRLWLAADAQCAAGMLLQVLPEREDHAQSEHRERDADAWPRATQLADTLRREELLALPAEEVIHRLYHEEDMRLFQPQPVMFHCNCSRQSVGNMLRMLGRAEVDSILEERGSIEIHCEFCNQRYEFDSVDAAQLFAETIPAAGSETRH
jgi:molecular chaperone Hsp33